MINAKTILDNDSDTLKIFTRDELDLACEIFKIIETKPLLTSLVLEINKAIIKIRHNFVVDEIAIHTFINKIHRMTSKGLFAFASKMSIFAKNAQWEKININFEVENNE